MSGSRDSQSRVTDTLEVCGWPSMSRGRRWPPILAGAALSSNGARPSRNGRASQTPMRCWAWRSSTTCAIWRVRCG